MHMICCRTDRNGTMSPENSPEYCSQGFVNCDEIKRFLHGGHPPHIHPIIALRDRGHIWGHTFSDNSKSPSFVIMCFVSEIVSFRFGAVLHTMKVTFRLADTDMYRTIVEVAGGPLVSGAAAAILI
jgi:hypothetical protein